MGVDERVDVVIRRRSDAPDQNDRVDVTVAEQIGVDAVAHDHAVDQSVIEPQLGRVEPEGADGLAGTPGGADGRRHRLHDVEAQLGVTSVGEV